MSIPKFKNTNMINNKIPEKDINEGLRKEVTSFSPKVITQVKEDAQEIIEDVLEYFIPNIILHEYNLSKDVLEEIKNRGVILNLDLINNREKLIHILNKFFSKYYIEGMNYNYENFKKLISNFEDIKSGKIENPKIGTKIVEFDETRRKNYEKFILNFSEYSGQLIKVECSFSRIYIEVEKGKEIIFDYKFDEFIAFMFCKGIRFGLNIKEINKGLISQYHKGTIADITPATVGKSSNLEVIIDLKLNKTPIDSGTTGSVDFKKFKCRFPQISCEENEGLIAIKQKPTNGKDGMYIDGSLIKGYLGEDKINLQVLCGVGTYFTEDENKIYIKAKESGFVSAEMEFESPGVQKPTKISVKKEIEHVGDIGKETGSLDVTSGEKVFLLGSVGKYYELIGNNIRLDNGNVEGSIISLDGNINIFGSVINGKIIANNGNAFINKSENEKNGKNETGRVITGSYIEAVKGEIEIEYAEFSTIIGDKVKIKKAVGCTIICNTLESEEINACNLVIKKSLNINKLDASFHQGEKDSLKTKETRIILLFKNKIIGNIETLKKIKRKMAIYLDKENSSPEALNEMEELNKILNQISSKQEEIEGNIDINDYKININYGKNEDYLKIKLADFFESFEIEDLNNNPDRKEFKKQFLEKLLKIFIGWDSEDTGGLYLGNFDYNNKLNNNNSLSLDYLEIKDIVKKELEQVDIIIDGNGINDEYVVELGYVKKDDGKPVDIIIDNPIKMDVFLDEGLSIKGLLTSINIGLITFCLSKSDIDNKYDIFLHKNDYINTKLKLDGYGNSIRDFNLTLLITSRQDIGDKILLSAKYIGLRGQKDTYMRQCIKKFEIEAIRLMRERQQTSILDKKLKS